MRPVVYAKSYRVYYSFHKWFSLMTKAKPLTEKTYACFFKNTGLRSLKKQEVESKNEDTPGAGCLRFVVNR